ncbi:hypothetical protein [Streptomyces sp. NBC_00316]|uniref:hypothetical protein n=1 Tax=Streptomyces sp. NBC_00316 TaxID=2975710 RepID=UPI002E298643|nr:hypothetical protein [Streptomyces sp. NBC_00316]
MLPVRKPLRGGEQHAEVHQWEGHSPDRAYGVTASPARTRGIVRAGNALGRGEDGDATAMVLATSVVTIAAFRWLCPQ